MCYYRGMRNRVFALAGALALLLVSPFGGADGAEPAAVPAGAVWVLEVEGAIGPAISDYAARGLAAAGDGGAALAVLRMNTPGGLDGAMRDIIAAILASPVPVATFVSPQGSRAASAGTYILYASHIAAMAPATNLGAATPVSIGAPGMPSPPAPQDEPEADSGTADSPAADAEENADAPTPATAMERKMINDAAAYIRGLAELRGRNAEWAEQAVREAVSLSAQEALEMHVIDVVADDIKDLLEQLHGREIDMSSAGDGGAEPLALALNDAVIHEHKPDWRTRFLATITNPSLVLILGMIGFYGIILEFYNPGALVPGTVGVICLLLAGYALQLLPVNYAGLALLLVGLGLMLAEALSPSFGILGGGGLAAFMIGGVLLFDTEVEAFRIGWPVLLATGLVTGGLIIATISIALRMRRRPAAADRMLGETGVALTDIAGAGQARILGEIWEAKSAQPIQSGDPVRVIGVSGLVLSVEKEATP